MAPFNMLRRALILVTLCSATALARQSLPPGTGLIAGQVVDGVTGRGVPEATVMLRQFLPVVDSPTERTDDLGEFRVTGLSPGAYLVAVPGLRPTISRATLTELDGASRDRTLGELMRATNEVAQADMIAVGAGEEFTTAHIRLFPVPTVAVAGTIVSPPDSTEPAGRAAVRLVNASFAGILSPQDFSVASTLGEPDGSFVMLGVPAGRYTAVAENTRELPIAEGGMVGVTASATVDVGGSPLIDLALPLQLMAPLMGRLVFGGGEVPNKSVYEQSVTVQPASALPSSVVSSRMDPSGLFKLLLRPGRYFLSPGLRGPWAVKSITHGGRNIYDAPVEIGAEPIADVVITYEKGVTARLDGNVTLDSGAPAAGRAVVVFPADAALRVPGAQPPHRFFAAATSTTGSFAVQWAAPGHYLVAAIAPEDVPDWRAPAQLERLSRAAQAITLTSGETSTVTLKVISLAARVPSPVLPDDRHDDGVEEGHGPFVRESAVQAAGAPQRDGVRPAATAGTGRLEGVVMSADEPSQPVRNVRVSVQSADGRLGVTVSSDEAGRFEVGGLAAGEYRLTVDKAGWLGIPFGAMRPGGAGTGITLTEAQQRAGLTMRMARGAALSGVVTNAQSAPMPGIRVEALRKQLHRLTGQWQLTSVASDTTDDRGVFRVHSLRSGDYVLRATDPAVQIRSAGTPVWRLTRDDVNRALALGGRPTSALPDAVSADFGPVTYPDPTGSSLLTLKTGQDMRGLSVVMSAEPLAVVRGSVRRSDGLPLSNVGLSIFRGGPDAELLGLSTILVGEGRADAQGRFALRPVPAGTYTVRARVQGEQLMWASETLTVSGPVEVALDLRPAMTVRGRVVLEGTDVATTPVPPVQVWLLPVGTGSELNGPRTNAAKDGTFTLTGVFPGRYSFTNTGVPDGEWTWRESVVNGRAGFDSTIVVEPGQDVEWELRFTKEPTRLTGRFTDAGGRPVSEYTLVVFTEQRAWWRAASRLIRTTRPNTDGTFTVAGLPPGMYHLAAVTDIEEGDQYSAEWLATLVPSALTVVLRDKSVTTQDIRIGGT